MMKKQYFLSLLVCFAASALYAQPNEMRESRYVRSDAKGHLLYTPDSLGNIIPDFSRVGYREGRVALPFEKMTVILFPPDTGSAQGLIQAAIDELSKQPIGANGLRGTILLRKGIYKIPGTIKIQASGIVLRGEGEETVLVATGKGQRSLIYASGTGNWKEITGTRKKISGDYVPVGTHVVTVEGGGGFHVGDSIMIFRPCTQQWIHDLKMDEIAVRDSTTLQWAPNDYDLYFERVVRKVNGDEITLDNPVVMEMSAQYGGGEVFRYSFAGRIRNVGVEHLTCISEYNGDEDEDHGWNAVNFNRLEDGWVRNVTARYFGYSCVNLGEQSRNITVTDCKCLDAKSKITGGRRYSFNNDGQMNLVMNCFASEGRHDYVTGARVRGPNVFFNCKAEKTHADIGPHHRWAMGTLYDNIVSDGEINAQDRGNWGTGHGWSGVNQVFWNCTSSKFAIQDPWVSGKNYVVGMKGTPYAGRLPGRNPSFAEFTDVFGVSPGMLYLAQLHDPANQ